MKQAIIFFLCVSQFSCAMKRDVNYYNELPEWPFGQNADINTQLIQVAKAGDRVARLVVPLLEKGADPKIPLEIAVAKGRVHITRQICKWLKKENKLDLLHRHLRDGNSYLHLATGPDSDIDVMRTLIAYGATVNAVNSDRTTPLHLLLGRIIRKNNEATIRSMTYLLINRGANLQMRDNRNKTPRNLLFVRRYGGTIRSLIDGIHDKRYQACVAALAIWRERSHSNFLPKLPKEILEELMHFVRHY